jgi:hypothetical protein
MAKRAGRMYDSKGLQNTARGELALACPACPIPGVNLPPGWEKAPSKDRYCAFLGSYWLISIFFRFLYQLYVAIDANFKLKAKNRGAKAIMFSDGYAYIVRDADYARHLSENTDDMKEVRLMPRCLRHYN